MTTAQGSHVALRSLHLRTPPLQTPSLVSFLSSIEGCFAIGLVILRSHLRSSCLTRREIGPYCAIYFCLMRICQTPDAQTKILPSIIALKSCPRSIATYHFGGLAWSAPKLLPMLFPQVYYQVLSFHWQTTYKTASNCPRSTHL